jgi:hypothetical protein
LADHQRTGSPPERHRTSAVLRGAWVYVLLAALTVGGWSMFHFLHYRLGLPGLIAIVGALVFDGAGLIFSEYARAAIDRGRGFTVPGLCMLAVVAVSAFVNYSHGVTLGWGTAAGAALGAIPLVLELLFLARNLDSRLDALHRARLLPERLPRVGVLGAVMFPMRSWRAIRAVIGRRLDIIEAGLPAGALTTVSSKRAEVVEDYDAPADALDGPASPKAVRALYDDPRCHAIRALYERGTRPTTTQMQNAVADAGHGQIPPSTARTLRTVIEAVEPGLADLPAKIAHGGAA